VLHRSRRRCSLRLGVQIQLKKTPFGAKYSPEFVDVRSLDKVEILGKTTGVR
jgi:hypothetical protein